MIWTSRKIDFWSCNLFDLFWPNDIEKSIVYLLSTVKYKKLIVPFLKLSSLYSYITQLFEFMTFVIEFYSHIILHATFIFKIFKNEQLIVILLQKSTSNKFLTTFLIWMSTSFMINLMKNSEKAHMKEVNSSMWIFQ